MALSNLRGDARTHGVLLDDRQLAAFERYATLLGEWSQRANLVGDATPSVVERRHFLESLAFGVALRERELLRPDSTVLDLGTGAGFPGVPMKIAWPGLRLSLLEATGKKTEFLQALVAALRLEDVRILAGRAEDLAHDPTLRASFDLVTARAVAPLPALLELALPFARVGGRLATVKGSRAAAELAAARQAVQTLGARTAIFDLGLRVPGPAQHVVVAVKLRPTPDDYPRRPGVPAKSPL